MRIRQNLRGNDSLLVPLFAIAILQIAGMTQAFGQQDSLMLAPRALMRQLLEGREAIADERYTDAVTALTSLLTDDAPGLPEDLRGQDFFLQQSSGLQTASLKGEANRLLSELPPQGRRILELQFGVKARRELEQAMLEQDVGGIESVVRKYGHTEAGYDATCVLAALNITEGYPLAGADLFQRLLDYPAARARYGPQLAAEGATAWLLAARPDMAIATMTLAEQDFMGRLVSFNGQQIRLDGASDWSEIIESAGFAGRPANQIRGNQGWLVSGGSASRDAKVDIGLPVGNELWQSRIHSSVLERDSLVEAAKKERKGGLVLMPTFELRMAQNTVMCKTTDDAIVGIDMSNGLLKWVKWFGSAPARLTTLPMRGNAGNNAISRELQSRAWGSTAFGRFSSDGYRLFTVSLGTEEIDNSSNFGRRLSLPKITNYLEGVSIDQEGSILWRVGGDDGDAEPALAGAFFLGPPTPYAGKLYSMVEINGEIKLVVLEPETGRLLWQQQLAQASKQIGIDPTRQKQATSPTIADGVILCPTAANAVLAIDLVTRSLRWGVTYHGSTAGPLRGNLTFAPPAEFEPLKRRWRDAGMVANNGVIAMSHVDWGFFECRDILTGASVYKQSPRGSMYYLAGFHNNTLIVVGAKEVVAYDLENRTKKWSTSFSNFGPETSIAGKGIWKQDSIMLPLTGNRIAEYSLDYGTLIDSVQLAHEVGNLFAYNDKLLSASTTEITAYYARDSLQRKTDALIAEDPQDATALTFQGQLALADGDIDQAISLLKAAFDKDQNADTRFLLIDALLKGLKQTPDRYLNLAEELDWVVELSMQRSMFLQQLAISNLRSENYAEAFKRLVQMMDYLISDRDKGHLIQTELIEVDPGHTVEMDQWVAVFLSRTYELADEKTKRGLDKLVEDRLAEVRNTMVPIQRSRLRYLKWLPQAAEMQLALADQLQGNSDQTTAEHILAPLLLNEEFRQRAEEFMMRPVELDKMLKRTFGMRDYSQPIEEDGPTEWPMGTVEHNLYTDQGIYPILNIADATSQRWGRPEFQVSLIDSALRIVDNNGNPLLSLQLDQTFNNSATGLMSASIRGGMILVETTSELLCFDLYRGILKSRDALLWRYSLINATPDRPYSPPAHDATSRHLGFTKYTRRLGRTGIHSRFIGSSAAAAIIQLDKTLIALDPLNGAQLWQRTGYEHSLEYALDGLELAVVNESAGQVEVLDVRDGSIIRSSELTEDRSRLDRDQRLCSAGNLVVDAAKVKRKTLLRVKIWNPITNEIFWQADVPQDAKGALLGHRYLVIETFGGEGDDHLHYFDLKQRVHKDFPVDLRRSLVQPMLRKFGDQLVVFRRTNARRQTIVFEEGIDGPVYTIDTAKHEIAWDEPGQLSDVKIPSSQPNNSPFFVAYSRSNEERTDGIKPIRLAVIDSRDGRVVFSDRTEVRSLSFNVRLRPSEKIVEVSIGGNRNYRLQMKDGDRPPAPVVQFTDLNAK